MELLLRVFALGSYFLQRFQFVSQHCPPSAAVHVVPKCQYDLNSIVNEQENAEYEFVQVT